MLKKDRWNDALSLFLHSSSSQKSHTVFPQIFVIFIVAHFEQHCALGTNFYGFIEENRKKY